MEINTQSFVFQCDSDIVKQTYQEQDNYLIQYSKECPTQEYCAIYFCSNDIYYPNTQEIFRKRIIEKNFYEWYGSRIHKACKHIFVRDIQKQWYLAGINAKINTPEKLADFLRNETKGYKIITLGSSAGGYSAMLFGSILKADKVIAFNPQFEIKSLLDRSTEAVNPLVFRLKDTGFNIYYDLNPLIDESVNIYYLFSNQSQWDIGQYRHSKNLKLKRIAFATKHHGIPFLKIALTKVLNLEDDKLNHYTNKINHPITFTIKMVGIKNTVLGFIVQAYQAYKKRH